MRIVFSQTARDDITRQSRYYAVDQDVPEVANRFREAVRAGVEQIKRHPFIGAPGRTANERTWTVKGFPAFRIHYRLVGDGVHIRRVLHGKRNLPPLLRRDS